MDELLQTLSRLHTERAIAVETNVTPGQATAIDPADLYELLGNLLDNAFRHARSRITVDAQEQGQMLVVRVSDDGPGIAKEERDRATVPGIRLDERGDGHGFGLTIAREIAELYGGTLTLDGAPVGGLAAAISIPLAATGPFSG